ncbi:MAG: hypothetical protein ACK5S5_18540 [Planctomycetota bacterium]
MKKPTGLAAGAGTHRYCNAPVPGLIWREDYATAAAASANEASANRIIMTSPS